jgi:tripartite-type tricarboxylate transporter receptor subunit TctC
VTYVPYKGTGPAQTALLGGETAATMASVVSVGPHVSSGKLRALGVTTARRSKIFPNLPTLSEQGAAGFDYSTFFGWVAPAKTPAAIVNLLNAELLKAIDTPQIAAKFKEDGAEPMRSTPAEFREFIASEVMRWRKVVQETGIKAE